MCCHWASARLLQHLHGCGVRRARHSRKTIEQWNTLTCLGWLTTMQDQCLGETLPGVLSQPNANTVV